MTEPIEPMPSDYVERWLANQQKLFPNGETITYGPGGEECGEYFVNGEWVSERPPNWPNGPAEEIAEDAPKRLLRGSLICLGTETLLGSVLTYLGLGFPDSGDDLLSSASMFDEAGSQIADLVPGGSWRGAAAQAYAANNLAQSQRAKLIGDLDRLTAGLVSTQADAVTTARWIVGAEMAVVGGTGACCLYWESLGPAGQVLSLQVALTVCAIALATTLGFLFALLSTTSRNASGLHLLTKALAETVTGLLHCSDEIAGVSGAAPPPSEFDATHHTASRPERPDTTHVFENLAGTPEFCLPTAPSPGFADFGAPHLPILGLAGMPSLPDSFPGLPNPSGALAGLSGPVARLNQLANTAAQQVQMISSLAQHGVSQPTTPAEHHPHGQDNTVAAGTATDERAPVDAATAPRSLTPTAQL
ncbi:EspA/EspE family type VII secretion system effector [Mycobacterium marinum]|uniref:EspA/EspE family type VII secretion system effector n=1 Tax=Mycobacterium marinum TaxID=1781 RepID=UPI0035626D10